MVDIDISDSKCQQGQNTAQTFDVVCEVGAVAYCAGCPAVVDGNP